MVIEVPRSNSVAMPATSNRALGKKPTDSRRFAFTAARIRRMLLPARGAIYAFDELTPGLALRVTAAGSRTFVFYRRINDRPPWLLRRREVRSGLY